MDDDTKKKLEEIFLQLQELGFQINELKKNGHTLVPLQSGEEAVNYAIYLFEIITSIFEEKDKNEKLLLNIYEKLDERKEQFIAAAKLDHINSGKELPNEYEMLLRNGFKFGYGQCIKDINALFSKGE